MVGYYYKTGTEIHEIVCFMEKKLKLSYIASPSSLKTGQTYGWKPYRFSFFLNAQNKFVYLIEPLANDETDYEQLAKRCQSKEEKKMTKEEALKKIEELKAFVEKLDEEIPKMKNVLDAMYKVETISIKNCQSDGIIAYAFLSEDTRDCYMLKAFELAHLMYAREHLKLGATGEDIYSTTVTGTRIDYNTCWKLYFDKNICEYQLSHHNSVECLVDSVDPWIFGDREDALKVANYMNKYVKDKVKELY